MVHQSKLDNEKRCDYNEHIGEAPYGTTENSTT